MCEKHVKTHENEPKGASKGGTRVELPQVIRVNGLRLGVCTVLAGANSSCHMASACMKDPTGVARSKTTDLSGRAFWR